MIDGAVMSYLTDEIASQPECWSKAIEMAGSAESALPGPGHQSPSSAAAPPSTSLGAMRRSRGRGPGLTDALPPEFEPRGVRRSGVVSRVGHDHGGCSTLLAAAAGGTPTVASRRTPLARRAPGARYLLDFADERVIVSARFITSSVVLLRAHPRRRPQASGRVAAGALAAPPPGARARSNEFTFLGRGWTIGLAYEAALKLRETARAPRPTRRWSSVTARSA